MLPRKSIHYFALLTAGSLVLATGALAQPDDPFADGADPFASAPADPFAAPEDSAAVVEDDVPPGSPFDTEPVTDPSDNPEAFQPVNEPDPPFDPFSTTEPQTVDPFSGVPPATEDPGDAFTTQAGPGADTNPFEANVEDMPGLEGAEEASPFGDLFGEDTPFSEDGGEGESEGVATLHDFRYIEVPRPDGTTVIARQRMTWEEAQQWDEDRLEELTQAVEAGEYNAYAPGASSAREWAQWLLYAEQLEYWQRYSQEIVLVNTEAGEREFAIVWPGDPESEEEPSEDVGGDGRPRNIYNENRSLDEQLTDFNPLPDTRQGTQGQSVLDPEQMNAQSVALYKQYMVALRDHEKQQQQFTNQLLVDINRRRDARNSYAAWRDSQLQNVLAWVSEWNRRYSGKVAEIEGVRYELYAPDNVPQFAPRGANVVVTDFDLTPYDILNEDGTLRGPAR